MFVKILVVLVIMLESSSCFLMNSSSNAGGNVYQDLISLLVDEKNARHQLEDRLDKLEEFNNEVVNELHKSRNNRQQLIDQNTKLSTELDKAKARLMVLEQEYDILKRNLTNQTSDLHSILAELVTLSINSTEQSSFNEKLKVKVSDMEVKQDNLESNLQNISNSVDVQNTNITISQERLFEKVLNLTNGQELLSKKYHTLLEQYLAVTSQSRDRFVEKGQFVDTVRELTDNLLDINITIQNITLQTTWNRQKIMEQGVQLGFSLRTVDQASSSDRLKFTQALFNTGNMVNMSTGEFVCKRAGLYFLTTTIVRQPGIKESFCFIFVSTQAINRIWTQGTVGQASSTSGYASGTTALVYHLNVGDKVYLGQCHGIDHMYRESSFSGFLIIPD